MSSLRDVKIDEVIFSVVEATWREVASVIIKVADTMGSDLPEGDAGFNLVSNRIEILVRYGHLLAQGKIKNWRYSELRKPD